VILRSRDRRGVKAKNPQTPVVNTESVQVFGKISFDVEAQGRLRRPAHSCMAQGHRRAVVRRQPRFRIDPSSTVVHERGMPVGHAAVPLSSDSARRRRLARLEMDDDHSAATLRTGLEPGLTPAHRDLLNGSLEHRLARNLYLVLVRRRRNRSDGAQGRGGVVGLGLHLGLARAQLRARALGVR